MLEKKLDELIEAKKNLDLAKENYEKIKTEVGEVLDENINHNGYDIIKYIKLGFKLKDDVDETDIILEYPKYVKTKFDATVFAKNEGSVAKKYIDIKETVIVSVKKSKEK